MATLLTRSNVEAFSQMLLAAHTGRYSNAHGFGASDAAFGRVYAHSRLTHYNRDEYDLGFRVGRFILFAKLPAWRAPMVTHKDAQEWWTRFQVSPEGRPGD
jgi:hypothetical protein